MHKADIISEFRAGSVFQTRDIIYSFECPKLWSVLTSTHPIIYLQLIKIGAFVKSSSSHANDNYILYLLTTYHFSY